MVVKISIPGISLKNVSTKRTRNVIYWLNLINQGQLPILFIVVSLYAVQKRMPFFSTLATVTVSSFARLIINWQSLCADVVAKLEWARSSERVNLTPTSLLIHFYAGVDTCQPPSLTLPLPHV